MDIGLLISFLGAGAFAFIAGWAFGKGAEQKARTREKIKEIVDTTSRPPDFARDGCLALGSEVKIQQEANDALLRRLSEPEKPEKRMWKSLDCRINHISEREETTGDTLAALLDHLRLTAEFGPRIVIKKKGKGK